MILAWSQLDTGHVEEADETISAALKIAESRQSKINFPDLLRVRAMIRVQQQRWEEAGAIFDEAVSLARSLRYPYAEARALQEFALMSIRLGDAEQAREQLLAALEIFRRLGAMNGVARSEQSLLQLDATLTRG